MPNYARSAATALRVIAAAGVPIVLTKPRTDDYEPETGSADARKGTTFVGSGVRDEFAAGDVLADAAAGSRTRAAEMTLYAVFDDMVGADPQSGDQVTVDGDAGWLVNTSLCIQPGPVIVLYEIKLRTP